MLNVKSIKFQDEEYQKRIKVSDGNIQTFLGQVSKLFYKHPTAKPVILLKEESNVSPITMTHIDVETFEVLSALEHTCELSGITSEKLPDGEYIIDVENLEFISTNGDLNKNIFYVNPPKNTGETNRILYNYYDKGERRLGTYLAIAGLSPIAVLQYHNLNHLFAAEDGKPNVAVTKFLLDVIATKFGYISTDIQDIPIVAKIIFGTKTLSDDIYDKIETRTLRLCKLLGEELPIVVNKNKSRGYCETLSDLIGTNKDLEPNTELILDIPIDGVVSIVINDSKKLVVTGDGTQKKTSIEEILGFDDFIYVVG